MGSRRPLPLSGVALPSSSFACPQGSAAGRARPTRRQTHASKCVPDRLILVTRGRLKGQTLQSGNPDRVRNPLPRSFFPIISQPHRASAVPRRPSFHPAQVVLPTTGKNSTCHPPPATPRRCGGSDAATRCANAEAMRRSRSARLREASSEALRRGRRMGGYEYSKYSVLTLWSSHRSGTAFIFTFRAGSC
ncbi:hypothetical protein MTO96_000218 [Rhipicephalus appendiculatus]